jgi:hypothetical protein
MDFIMDFIGSFIEFVSLFYRRTRRQIKQAGLPDLIGIPVSLYVAVVVGGCVGIYALIIRLVVRFFTTNRRPWKIALTGIFMVWLLVCLLLRVFTPSAADRDFERGGYNTATHTISKGETLWEISGFGQAAFGLSDRRVYLNEIFEINPELGSSGGHCQAGQTITLPVPAGMSVGDMLYPD